MRARFEGRGLCSLDAFFPGDEGEIWGPMLGLRACAAFCGMVLAQSRRRRAARPWDERVWDPARRRPPTGRWDYLDLRGHYMQNTQILRFPSSMAEK